MAKVPDTEGIARLHIRLEDFEPAIWRRVEVPMSSTLKAIHDVVQAALCWNGYHLHLFAVGDERYGVPDPERGRQRPTRSEKSCVSRPSSSAGS